MALSRFDAPSDMEPLLPNSEFALTFFLIFIRRVLQNRTYELPAVFLKPILQYFHAME